MQCVIYTQEAGRYEPGPLVSMRRDELTAIRYNLYGSELFLRHDDRGLLPGFPQRLLGILFDIDKLGSVIL